MKEVQKIMGKVVNEALQAIVFTEIVHTQHLATTRRHLERRGTAIAVGNHISANDPVSHSKALAETTTSDHMTFVGSRRHFDPSRGKFNAVKGVLRDWLQEAYGIDIALVTQTKDRPTYPDWRYHDLPTYRRLEAAVIKPGQLVYLLLEGERSKTGGLLPAEKGFDHLLSKGGDNLLVLPITEAYTDLSFIKGRSRLTIGEPLFRPQIMTEVAAINQRIAEQRTSIALVSPADVAMLHIGQPLPPQNHGHYTQLMEISRGLISA